MSRVDILWRRMILSTFFKQGWGKPEDLRRIFAFRRKIKNREYCNSLIPRNYPVTIEKEEVKGNVCVLEGSFTSPLVKYLPDIMPEEVQTARFQALIPKEWDSSLRPVCLQLGGTGDHGFSRRRKWMAQPLLKDGIASVILENPYYGCRKPKDQRRSGLLNVSDLFVMGAGLMLECMVLLHWCERRGLGPLGITGISMGGFMASLAASVWNKPISLVPCLSWTSASAVFTKGVMSGSIPWKTLEQKFYEVDDYREMGEELISPEQIWESPYSMGKDFVQHYPESIKFIRTDREGGHVEVVMAANGPVTVEQIPLNKTSLTDTQVTEFSDIELLDNSDGSAELSIKERLINSFSFGNLSPANIVWPSWFTFNDKNFQERIQEVIKKSRDQKSPNGNGNGKVDIASQVLCRDTLEFMIGILDECTHLGNYAIPVDPELIIIISADRDAYVPRGYSTGLNQIWPGAELRRVDNGHIGAFLLRHSDFRQAIKDAFKKQEEKYFS